MRYLEGSWASLEHPIKCCSPMAKEGIMPAAVLNLDIGVEEIRRIIDPTNSGWGDFDDDLEVTEGRISGPAGSTWPTQDDEDDEPQSIAPTGSTWPGDGEDEGNLDRPYPEPGNGDDEDDESEG
jgi:hypothetical protein